MVKYAFMQIKYNFLRLVGVSAKIKCLSKWNKYLLKNLCSWE